jgi:hypothetical protein
MPSAAGFIQLTARDATASNQILPSSFWQQIICRAVPGPILLDGSKCAFLNHIFIVQMIPEIPTIHVDLMV